MQGEIYRLLNLDTLGEYIRTRREFLGLSQEALAYVTGITKEYLWGIETGKKIPSLLVLKNILRVLNVNLFAKEENYLDKEIKKLLNKYEKKLTGLEKTRDEIMDIRKSFVSKKNKGEDNS